MVYLDFVDINVYYNHGINVPRNRAAIVSVHSWQNTFNLFHIRKSKRCQPTLQPATLKIASLL